MNKKSTLLLVILTSFIFNVNSQTFEHGPEIADTHINEKWQILEGEADLDSFEGESVIILNDDSIITPKLGALDYLSDSFTVSFDAYFDIVQRAISYQTYEVRLWSGIGKVAVSSSKGEGYYGPIAFLRHGIRLKERIGDSEVISHQEFNNLLKGELTEGVWRSIKIAYRQGNLKLLIDEQEVYTINSFKYKPTMISIGAQNTESKIPLKKFIKNIKIEGISLSDNINEPTNDESDSQINENPINDSNLGLVPIDESKGVGWRLAARDPNNYGDIGNNAIDISYSKGASNEVGATGSNSVAMGYNTMAAGKSSLAMGHNSKATGDYANAFGQRSIASGLASNAFGSSAVASGDYSFAYGYFTQALGKNSFAFGNGAKAIGDFSISIGQNSMSKNGSISIGKETEATAELSVALGHKNLARGTYSFAIGDRTTADGITSVALGALTKASNFYSMAVGYESKAIGQTSFATGFLTEAIGKNSFSLGENTKARGSTSVAMGKKSQANGNTSLATGTETKSEGENSATFGKNTISNAPNSVAMGVGTVAQSDNSLVIGQYNELVFTNNEILFQIGRGTEDYRIDAFKVYKNGNANLSQNLSVRRLDEMSDKRLKKDIDELSYGLKEILQLNPKSYFWKNQENNQKSMGLIAQDVRKVIKEIVSESNDKDKTLTISYTSLIPVLINAIQDQQQIIENQNSKINALNKELINNEEALNNLNERVKQIESFLTPKQL